MLELLAGVNTVVYGNAMSVRLTKEDWLDHGLKTLALSGFGALKVDRLAKSLNVSRGSFYWHFRDIAHFHAEILDCWRQRATLQVIESVEQKAIGVLRLNLLMRRAFSANDGLERAVRAWATQSPDAAKTVAMIDRERVGYLAQLFSSSGIATKHASARAAFLYFAYLGRIMVADENIWDLQADEIDGLAELLQR